MKKTNPTILYLSLHFPKTLKNGYIHAFFSLFPRPDLAITYTVTWPPDSTPVTYWYPDDGPIG